MFKIKPLSYNLGDLSPVISEQIMNLHFNKHYQAYTDNFNRLLQENNLENTNLNQIFAQISTLPQALINNAGGHYNHKFFWQCLTPPNSKQNQISDKMLLKIQQSFESFDNFKTEFTNQATALFGSGWVNLVETETGTLKIIPTYNQDAIGMDFVDKIHGKNQLILNLDVWEHAYYLDYQNRRADYIANFWQIINWDFVESNLKH